MTLNNPAIVLMFEKPCECWNLRYMGRKPQIEAGEVGWNQTGLDLLAVVTH